MVLLGSIVLWAIEVWPFAVVIIVVLVTLVVPSGAVDSYDIV